MTFGALVLDWVQPNSVAVATPSIGLIAPLNGSVNSWNSIHVLPQRASGGRPTDTHWIVDRDGRVVATDNWKTGRRLMPRGEIRVSLVAPALSNEITPRQWSAAQELLVGLQKEYQIPRALVAVDDTLDIPRVSAPSYTAQPRS